MISHDQYINGQWIAGGGAAFTSADPVSDKTLWTGKMATSPQVDQAVTAAEEAFDSWADTPLTRRIDAVQKFAGELQGHVPDLAQIICQETGKPRWEATAEVGTMIGKINLSIAAYNDRCQSVGRDLDGQAAVTRFKPHGVCAVLGPFNLPGHIPNAHIIPALIAGNTVVFKPSQYTPAVAQKIIELWDHVNLPPGVINLVQGDGDAGAALARHPQIDGLFFTGSSRVGLMLSRLLADQPNKILALEMGGNNPLIVWESHDDIAAAYLAIQSAYITAGQRCTCARRLIVPTGHDGDAFIEQLQQMMTGIRVAPPNDEPQPFMGSLICPEAAQKLLRAQSTLSQRGASEIVTMQIVDACPAMLSPGLIDVTGVSDRADEELFGPLLQVIRVADFDAAIREVNRTRYGLAASLISHRGDLYERFYRRVRAGVVNWNRPTTGASGYLPFGGVGLSGNHRSSGYHAADYCSYPVASIESNAVSLPSKIAPGVNIDASAIVHCGEQASH